MSEVIQMEDMKRPEDIYRICKETERPFYVARENELELVIMHISVHEQLFRQLVATRKELESQINKGNHY